MSTRGVYLFDEFDALGGERGTKHDVGEIRRVLNSFLQFIEQDDSDIEYALPTAELAMSVMQARLALLSITARTRTRRRRMRRG